MKTIINQFFHVEGNLYLQNNVAPPPPSEEDTALGKVITLAAVFCMIGLTAMFVGHLLDLAILWIERHAVTLCVTGTVAAATTCYIVYRIKKRDHAKALVSAPVADSVVADRCQPGHEPATAQRTAAAPAAPVAPVARQIEADPQPHLRIPNRDIETVFFTEQPLTINRHE